MLRGLLRLRPAACCLVLMGKSKGNRFYAVRVGYQPGIYHSWPDCEAQVLHCPSSTRTREQGDGVFAFVGKQGGDETAAIASFY